MPATAVAPALRALVDRFIDYAGIFPPAALTLDVAVSNYTSYRHGDFAWMLRSLVVATSELERVPKSLDGLLSVLAESDQSRAASIETRGIVSASRPVYCEVPLGNLNELDAIKNSGCFAKIRTGGLKPEAIPGAADVAGFIIACAERRLPFKATAGLHHPIRADHPLTYEATAPRAVMHGFLNVLMASVFAWHGERKLEPVLSEQDASAFSFDERGHWRDKSLTAAQITEARLSFIHSVGSCSFEEPVHELQALGLLPAGILAREAQSV